MVKDRKMTIALIRQIKAQEYRIKECGLFAMLGKIVLTEKGTYFSKRFK